MVPAKATPETFELYKKYQVSVHNDKPEKVTMRGFSRFLCDSPLGVCPDLQSLLMIETTNQIQRGQQQSTRTIRIIPSL